MDLGERVAKVEAVQTEHGKKLDEIGKDVKSLLATRSEARGSWKALVAAATAAAGAGGAGGAVLAWLRGH